MDKEHRTMRQAEEAECPPVAPGTAEEERSSEVPSSESRAPSSCPEAADAPSCAEEGGKRSHKAMESLVGKDNSARFTNMERRPASAF